VRKLKGTAKDSLGVTLGLNRRLEDGRAVAVSQPYPGRYTHHFAVADVEEMGEGFFSLVEEAYAFAMGKR